MTYFGILSCVEIVEASVVRDASEVDVGVCRPPNKVRKAFSEENEGGLARLRVEIAGIVMVIGGALRP